MKAFDSIQGSAKGIWFFYSYPLLMGGFMDKATVRGLRETELWLAEVDTALAWLGLLQQIFGLFHLHIFAVCARQKNTTSTVRHAHNFPRSPLLSFPLLTLPLYPSLQFHPCLISPCHIVYKSYLYYPSLIILSRLSQSSITPRVSHISSFQLFAVKRIEANLSLIR